MMYCAIPPGAPNFPLFALTTRGEKSEAQSGAQSGAQSEAIMAALSDGAPCLRPN